MCKAPNRAFHGQEGLAEHGGRSRLGWPPDARTASLLPAPAPIARPWQAPKSPVSLPPKPHSRHPAALCVQRALARCLLKGRENPTEVSAAFLCFVSKGLLATQAAECGVRKEAEMVREILRPLSPSPSPSHPQRVRLCHLSFPLGPRKRLPAGCDKCDEHATCSRAPFLRYSKWAQPPSVPPEDTDNMSRSRALERLQHVPLLTSLSPQGRGVGGCSWSSFPRWGPQTRLATTLSRQLPGEAPSGVP